jgi:hypothetical protein
MSYASLITASKHMIAHLRVAELIEKARYGRSGKPLTLDRDFVPICFVFVMRHRAEWQYLQE